jgi:hypothetical protein
MTGPTVERDERTIAVEGSGYRWSYLVLSFGLLLIIMVRSFVNHQSSWDLFGLVILGGVVNAGYQGAHQVLTRRWGVRVAVTMLASAVVAALLAVALAALRR